MTDKLDTRKVQTLLESLQKPIVLTGMMGSGKSYLGKILAKELNLPFYDSDQVIVERGGLSINEIFELYGEKKFREIECKTILELLESGPCIIATGGGALTTPATLDAVKQNSHTIWLKADIESLLKRLAKTKNRPLLKQDDPEQVLQNLMIAREPLYKQMHLHIETGHGDVQKALTEIIEGLIAAIN